ncbi:hypothetical protein CHFL109739_16035 [Chryseobacterium flavum]
MVSYTYDLVLLISGIYILYCTHTKNKSLFLLRQTYTSTDHKKNTVFIYL